MLKIDKEYTVALLLSAVGGFLEIYSYTLKDKVFSTTLTGNLVLMAYNMSFGNFDILKYISPMIAFVIGVYVAIKLKDKNKIFLIDIICIILILLFKNQRYNMLTVSFMTLMSAMQIQVFQSLRDKAYISTMMTGNIRKLITSIIEKDKLSIKIYLSVILSFALSVMLGGILIYLLKENAIIFLILPIITLYKLRKEIL